MSEKNSSNQGLFRCFQMFMHDVRQLEGQCRALGAGSDGDTRLEVATIKKQAQEIIGRFVKRTVDELKISTNEREKEVEYATVAFIDDRLIRLEWNLSELWSVTPLEMDMYGTRKAGSEFFDRLEKLDQTERIDGFVGLIYYFFISLGFLGKFDVQQDDEILESYQRQLLSLASTNQVGAYNGVLQLMQNLPVTESNLERKFLPTAKRFNFLSVLSIVAVALSVQLLWYYYSIELINIASSIISLDN